MSEHEKTWNTYVASWKATSEADKRALFQTSLVADCLYTDPLVQARGWDQLLTYMAQFQHEAPGRYFVTVEFSTHHGRSLAKWEMRDSHDEKVGEGVAYAEYDDRGRLASVCNFFPGAEG